MNFNYNHPSCKKLIRLPEDNPYCWIHQTWKRAMKCRELYMSSICDGDIGLSIWPCRRRSMAKAICTGIVGFGAIERSKWTYVPRCTLIWFVNSHNKPLSGKKVSQIAGRISLLLSSTDLEELYNAEDCIGVRFLTGGMGLRIWTCRSMTKYGIMCSNCRF